MRVDSKTWRILATLAMIAVMLIPTRGAGAVSTEAAVANPTTAATTASVPPNKRPQLSGALANRGVNLKRIGAHTDCPQAGVNDAEPPTDPIEDLSDNGDDIRVNQDLSCFPQNETSIAVNPNDSSNIVAGANDYRLGFGSSGFYATFDGGRTWKDGILPFPSLPSGDNLDGGGDPAIAFDRQGYAYYADINFNRTDDTNGIFVYRSFTPSTKTAGRTWTRPCVPIDVTPANPNDDAAVCGGNGDPRKPGDGVLNFNQDNNTVADGSVPFNDKEYIAAGPRPSGVSPQCFAPITKRVRTCASNAVGVDRVYVTWSLFNTFASIDTANVNIVLSYSDDRGQSWSPPKVISGAAPFCLSFPTPAQANRCNLNQFSVPTVHPTTGALYVGFENFNTPDENQYLVTRSLNGGQTFIAPRFVTSIYDVNYPAAGDGSAGDGNRPDCNFRGQFGRNVLTNSCFRVNSAGNIVVDKRGGVRADDVYVVISDNRNGTPARSNTDVFLFVSTNGALNWTTPVRVNNDFSLLSGDREDEDDTRVQGKDQWFPWVDISKTGDLNVVFHDRRLDRNSIRIEWLVSRQVPGNYLAWFFGAQCRRGVTGGDDQQGTTSSNCLLPSTRTLNQPNAPVNPGRGLQPGQQQQVFPFRNFALSDVPSNMDYSFRAGLFMGDYNNVAVEDGVAYGFWTDTRNGRSSRTMPGRNPSCEQADVYLDKYSASNGASDAVARPSDSWFLTPKCE